MSRVEGASMERIEEAVAPDAVAEAVADAEAYRGLCTACSQAPHCTFPRDPVKRVVHCDEFAGVAKPEIHLAHPAARFQLKVASAPAPVAAHKGLCADCEIREGCTFPRSETGVWHCEEYR